MIKTHAFIPDGDKWGADWRIENGILYVWNELSHSWIDRDLPPSTAEQEAWNEYMTDDTPAQRKPENKRLKHYRLRTNLSDDAGKLLDQLSQRKGLSRTAWIELTLREIARKEGIAG